MSFLEIAKKRYSVRSYQKTPVEPEKLQQVLEAGRIAPSAVNFQPWVFVVAQTEAARKKIATAYPREWLLQAPVIIVICGDHSQSWKRRDGKDHCDIDAAIAIDHMALAAADLGLGTCWVCAFDAPLCRQALGLPEHLEPIALLPLGYPADSPDPARYETKRKKLDQIVRWENI
ncbi:MAG TPA: nitroreductase family protein [Bacillota bacterium]|nr:nitroreductase family protein [Bacillota bacterium]